MRSGARGGASPPCRIESASPTQMAEKNFPLQMNEKLPIQMIEEHDSPHKSYSCTNITQEHEVKEHNEKHYPFKRQLSIPTTKETLAKINDVRKFLQVRHVIVH